MALGCRLSSLLTFIDCGTATTNTTSHGALRIDVRGASKKRDLNDITFRRLGLPRVDTANLISISEAAKRGVSKPASDAANGREQILMRNNKPVAAVIGMDRLDELDELQRLEEDMLDIILATTRLAGDNGKRYSLDDVLKHFGHTREDLRGVAE